MSGWCLGGVSDRAQAAWPGFVVEKKRWEIFFHGPGRFLFFSFSPSFVYVDHHYDQEHENKLVERSWVRGDASVGQ